MDEFEYNRLDAQIRLFVQIDLLPDDPQSQVVKQMKANYALADEEARHYQKMIAEDKATAIQKELNREGEVA